MVLAKSPRNDHYTSITIQNELVDAISDSVCIDIINKGKSEKFYLMIANEVTDAANKDELAPVLQCFYNGKIREAFIDFVVVE